MSKLFQALLSGIFVTFILDFFLFLGIKVNYTDNFDTKLYYNILFADNQNIVLFTLSSILLGYIVIYVNNKIALSIIGVLFMLSLATLIQPVGSFVGELLFLEKNVSLKTDKFSYRGDIYYRGRKDIIFYDYKLNKILYFDKNTIQGN